MMEILKKKKRPKVERKPCLEQTIIPTIGPRRPGEHKPLVRPLFNVRTSDARNASERTDFTITWRHVERWKHCKTL